MDDKKPRIECSVCHRNKQKPNFSKYDLEDGKIVCYQCKAKLAGKKRVSMKKELPAEIKKRKCLKCDRVFDSRNDYRICDSCKHTNRYSGEFNWRSHK